ncbi:glycosyltransferase [Streptococcus alactolyticus]|uniref:glycosyltransferase n=1 Tax=Streptococcus alactolyticus TaxID=29389 RepID=UPI003F9D3943
MKILHYALGFPPYRSGGLTKFCVDLMVQQAKEGHTVAMLWPGQMGFIKQKVAIKKHENVKLSGQDIQSFEVINPLPVSFDEGIADIAAFTKNVEAEAYRRLLDSFQPDVIHVHTLMGLHRSFLEAAKHKKIRLVFTAHDFFPICPKVTMFRHGAVCDCVQDCESCGVCNATALSLNKIKILQSHIYRELKDSKIVKKLRKQHRNGYLSESTANDTVAPVGTADDYKKLRNYYYSLLKLMDMIHYNSSVTKKVYESVFDLPNSRIVVITHSDIKDNRKKKDYSTGKLRIRYLGPMGGGKGFFLLRAALDELWSKQQNFRLDVHFTPIEMSPYIKVHDRYTYTELEKIFDETDVLVAPSIWYETFGFTVLEALSYGVPVIISGNVGAKDILVQGAGVVIENIDAQKLFTTLQNITPNKLRAMNEIIVDKQTIMQIENMSRQIETSCYGWKA